MDIIELITTAGFVLAVTPYVWRLGHHIHKIWVIKKYWDGEGNDYVIISPYHKDPASNKYRYVKHEDISAARRLERFLTKYGYNVKMKRSVDSLNDEEKSSNIIIAGSSRTNAAVKQFFPQLENQYCFNASHNENYILDKQGHVRITSPMDKGISADFALIVKMPNPNKPQKCVYYIAGIHAIGTWAAAKYVTDTRRLRNMPSTSKKNAVVGIIEAKFSGFCHISEFDDFVKPRIIPNGNLEISN